MPFASVQRAVIRLALALVLGLAVGALALPEHASAQSTQLFPGVTYEDGVQFTPHGPVAIRIVRGPRPTGLYRLRPTLSNETVLGRETVSSMQRRLASQATMVGVNGDLSRFADGKPSGVLLRDGVLVSPPNSNRSSAGIGLDGTLDVRRVRFFGTWRGTGQRRRLNAFNEEPGKNGLALFTPDWGAATPRFPGAYSVVLAPFPAAAPNVDLSSSVASTSQAASVPLAPDTAVLVARGSSAARLQAEAVVGAPMTVRLILEPDWATVADAIGGGPVIVRDGRPVFRANEAFTTSQIALRHPRTAVGQLVDGRVLLVVVDGRQSGYSVGMTTFEMAQTMMRLGAVRAMQLDGGGSSTLAFDGKVLNRPSDGRERPISTALMLQYYGVYAPPPAETVVSPNGDGEAEEQALSYKVVRPSTVAVTLTAPDGSVAFQESLARAPGRYDVPFPPAPAPPPPTLGSQQEPDSPPEGRWTLSVSSTDDQGLPSATQRRFWVNSTLGFLQVPDRVLLRRKGGRATIQWTQARAARVRVTVETPEGILVRTVSAGRFEPGTPQATWNGRLANGKLAAGGRYVVRVAATNELGTVELDEALTVRRVARARR